MLVGSYIDTLKCREKNILYPPKQVMFLSKH